MKQFFVKILMLCVISGATATIGAAQKNGKAALTSGGFPRVANNSLGTAASSQTRAGTKLIANLNFGNVAPIGLGARRIRITMPIRISATTNYRVELQKIQFGGDGIRPSDIGFGVSAAINAQILVAGNFAADPTTARIINGYPQFAATLADIAETPTVIFTGAPVTARQKAGDNDDSITVDLNFVVVAQYFTPTDNAQISLQLTIVPLD